MTPIDVVEQLWNMSSGMATDWPRLILLEALVKFKPEVYDTRDYQLILTTLRKKYK